MKNVVVLALLCVSFFFSALTSSVSGVEAAERAPVRALFLGDNRSHRPRERADQLLPVLQARGIDVTYTESLGALRPKRLAGYDCLIVFANHPEITPAQEDALLDYVASGGGFVPIHCASYCFLNSPRYIALVGGQFKSHGREVFRAEIIAPEHPVMKGFREFETWDESYVHTKHNEDRVVLMERPKGDHREPYTWVRTHGKGRVFYTAYGHDHRTWSHPAFHQLIERGIRWVVESKRSLEPPPAGLPSFEYKEEKIAFYPPGQGRRGDGVWNRMQLPLEPLASQRHLRLPPGFRAELFTSEPDIVKPMAMAWDARGRLWICESTDYPNDLQRRGEGNDRIKICEDRDGDGVAETFTTFADKLSIPTSLTFSNGGVLVAQPPDMLFLADTDGDDRADVRRVLFTGFRVYDTHAGPNNLRWGPDNWIWGTIGYAGFDGEVGGEKLDFRNGFFRMRPDGSKLEFLRSTTNNTWGFGFSEEGFAFASTANNDPSVFLPIVNRYYDAVEGMTPQRLQSIADDLSFYPVTDKVRQVDWHGRYTAAAGHALYTARSFPPEYWNRAAFVTGPTGHLVGEFVLERRGSEFVARNRESFLASDDEWTAPIMAEVGPDGALWVIDWYNYIVQHNPTPYGYERGKGRAYVTPLRDKQRGRIYRVVHENAERYEPASLEGASSAELVAALSHDNQLWRMTAQRLLVERGDAAFAGALAERVRNRDVDATGLNVGAMHSLWALQGLGLLGGQHPEANAVAVEALSHPAAGVRRAAVQVLPRTEFGLGALLAAKKLDDSDAHVRLETFLALSEMPTTVGVGPAIFAALNERRNFDDRWIPDAGTSAALRHARGFLDATLAGDAAHPSLATVVRLVTANYIREARFEDAIVLLETMTDADDAIRGAVFDGLALGWPRERHVRLTESHLEILEKLFADLPTSGRDYVIAFARAVGNRELFGDAISDSRKYLASIIADPKLENASRIEAAARMIRADDSTDSIRTILEQVGPQVPPRLARGIFQEIGDSRLAETGAIITEHWDRVTPRTRSTAISILLRRPAWTGALLRATEQGALDKSDIGDSAWQRILDHPDEEIRDLGKKLVGREGIPDPDRDKVYRELLPVVGLPGDIAKGKEIFHTKCSPCHKVKGEGGSAGPDLTNVNGRSSKDVLLEIIDPNRSVEGNYRQWTAITRDGAILNGLLASETRTTVEIIDATGQRHAIERRRIEQLVSSKLSLMPIGLEKDLSREDLASLLEYLASMEVADE